MIKKVEVLIVWILISTCCVITLGTMLATLIYPDGNTKNQIAKLLLKHVTIQTVVEDGKWSEKYPFDESRVEHFISVFNEYKKSINNFCTTSFPGSEEINLLVSYYKDKIMNYHVTDISSDSDSHNYVIGCVDNVVEFETNVKSLNIPFFYVQTPSKEGIAFYKGESLHGEELSIAERSYYLTSLLEDRGVEVINIGRDCAEKILFDASSHWLPSDGLDCARLISGKLQEDYGFDIDLQVYDKKYYNDLALQCPNTKQTIEDTWGYDFEVPCPKSNPRIALTYAEDELHVGNYNEIMFNSLDEWMVENVAYHNAYKITNSLIYNIHNEDARCDKMILIIGDSFNWPVGTYLALACKDVSIIHNASFTGSLISYIKCMKPDVVIMVYNDAEFHEIYTEDAYYLK